jgi:hypothetical protein
MPALLRPALQVLELIKLAEQQRCCIRYSKLRLVMPDGHFRQIRYLFNPATRGRFDLTEFDDNEYILSEDQNQAERRLGIRLP